MTCLVQQILCFTKIVILKHTKKSPLVQMVLPRCNFSVSFNGFLLLFYETGFCYAALIAILLLPRSPKYWGYKNRSNRTLIGNAQ